MKKSALILAVMLMMACNKEENNSIGTSSSTVGESSRETSTNSNFNAPNTTAQTENGDTIELYMPKMYIKGKQSSMRLNSTLGNDEKEVVGDLALREKKVIDIDSSNMNLLAELAVDIFSYRPELEHPQYRDTRIYPSDWHHWKIGYAKNIILNEKRTFNLDELNYRDTPALAGGKTWFDPNTLTPDYIKKYQSFRIDMVIARMRIQGLNIQDRIYSQYSQANSGSIFIEGENTREFKEITGFNYTDAKFQDSIYLMDKDSYLYSFLGSRFLVSSPLPGNLQEIDLPRIYYMFIRNDWFNEKVTVFYNDNADSDKKIQANRPLTQFQLLILKDFIDSHINSQGRDFYGFNNTKTVFSIIPFGGINGSIDFQFPKKSIDDITIKEENSKYDLSLMLDKTSCIKTEVEQTMEKVTEDNTINKEEITKLIDNTVQINIKDPEVIEKSYMYNCTTQLEKINTKLWAKYINFNIVIDYNNIFKQMQYKKTGLEENSYQKNPILNNIDDIFSFSVEQSEEPASVE